MQAELREISERWGKQGLAMVGVLPSPGLLGIRSGAAVQGLERVRVAREGQDMSHPDSAHPDLQAEILGGGRKNDQARKN